MSTTSQPVHPTHDVSAEGDSSTSIGTDPPVAAAASRTGSRAIWPLLIRLHFYAGILIAPFLVVAALTGLAYAVTPQLDALLYGDKLHVSSTSGSIRPIDEQVRAARAAHPEGTIASIQTPAGAKDTTRVVLNVDGLGEENQRTVFVDPYTSTVKGELTTWYGATPVTTWIDDLHRNLHLGAFGRNYSEIAASWLWVIAGGGLLMWLGRARTYRSGKKRHIVVPNLSVAKGVRRTRNWHASTGVWLIVGLFFLSATGLTWSNHAGARFELALDGLSAHRPALDTALPNSATSAPEGGHHAEAGAAEASSDVDPADIATVLTTARSAGLSGPVEIAVPADAASAWSATQTDNVWPVRKDAIAVDPATQKVTARNDFADWPVVAKLSGLGIQAHMGVLFGLINELLLIAVALGLLVVIFWGYRMWWQRRPTRAGQRRPVGTAPSRGAWRRTRPVVLVVGGVVTAGLCWALPLFGWTLIAFLLTDLYIGEFQRQRDAATREMISTGN
jgi:uncharacterized iron-regulated membrane protein